MAIPFNAGKNIVVGNNETGKSTLLEAINLGLTGQLNGRSLMYEMHPFLFNQIAVLTFISELKKGNKVPAPKFCIELFFSDDDVLAVHKGTNNSLKENVPGLVLSAELDDKFSPEYAAYIKNPNEIRSIPVEFYKIVWRNFAGNDLSSRFRLARSILIDSSNIKLGAGPNKYVMDIVAEHLEAADRAQLAISYRKTRDSFLADPGIANINEKLATKKGDISEKVISVALDSTSKGSWEGGIVTHLDEIPFPLIGKGEQNSVKIQLSMDAASKCEIFMVEEPENHLSHANLNRLTSQIDKHAAGRQVLLTTHSSFVLNKLGIENVHLFNGSSVMSLDSLSAETRDYFLKLPGHDTLRLVLASSVILVEGPSDELIVQKAFKRKHGCLPLEKGIDVITVRSLAFKRFLEISKALKIKTRVVTDNDGDVASLEEKYKDFIGIENISIHYDKDEKFKTLEPQLVKANGREVIAKVLDKKFNTDDTLLSFMEKNKTECALLIFNSATDIVIPAYIDDAIK